MNFETLHFVQEDRIGILTINRPEALNALNEKVLSELTSFADGFSTLNDIRVLIITGAGEKAFVAGADIKVMQGMDAMQAETFSRTAQAAFKSIESLPVPVIAAVNGFALGGGCELALACDMIIASEKAKFGLPEVTLGLLPCFGGTQRLPRAIGLFKAKEMIFSGEFYTAEACREMGFVNRVVASGETLNEARKLATVIASRSPVALAGAKRSLNEGVEMTLEEGLQQEAHLFGDLFYSEDQKEGISAFIEKRVADFKGN